MTPGERIRAAREAAGLSQSEVAWRCTWSRARQWQLEHDWRGSQPTLATLRVVAKELGISIGQLIDETNETMQNEGETS